MTHPTMFQYFSLIIYKLVLYRIVNRIVGDASWYVSYRGSAYRYTPSHMYVQDPNFVISALGVNRGLFNIRWDVLF